MQHIGRAGRWPDGSEWSGYGATDMQAHRRGRPVFEPAAEGHRACMEEKSQTQALDRTQASLPMVASRAATMTHDYKRNGTNTSFAALDVLTGMVIGQCLPRHRHTSSSYSSTRSTAKSPTGYTSI